MFCMQLWLKWREIWKEWKKELNTLRHCFQDAFSDSVYSLSKINQKWFAWCSCKSECKLHHNWFINELSVFIVSIFNIDEWFVMINKYVDLKVLDITVLLLHKFLSFIDWSSSRVFIPTFWLARVLDINVITRLEYSISISWLNSILISSRVRIRVFDLTHQAIENSEFNEKKYWLLLVEISRAESASSEFMRILTTTNRDFSSIIHK